VPPILKYLEIFDNSCYSDRDLKYGLLLTSARISD